MLDCFLLLATVIAGIVPCCTGLAAEGLAGLTVLAVSAAVLFCTGQA